jgi:hypothetical protein
MEVVMSNSLTAWILASVLLPTLAGCPNSGNTPPASGAGATAPGSHTDAGTLLDGGVDAADDEELVVQCPDTSTEAATLTSGLTRTSKDNKLIAKFVLSDPSPPERYNNDWTIDFTTADGTPVTDLSMMKTSQTWMPYHGHGWRATSVPMSEPGRYKVTLNFNMRGYFQIKLETMSANLGAEEIVFDYCLR